jgi:hypothetical protein
MDGYRAIIRAIIVMLAGVLLCAQAQWLNYPSPGTPRTRDGKANLSAPAPRTLDHRPDLSGVWQVDPAAGEAERLLGHVLDSGVVPGDDPRMYSKYFFDILADFKPDQEPMKPAAAELFRKHTRAFPTANTEAYCLPVGLPRAELLAVPFKIAQTPELMIMIYEVDGTHRQIYTDGRKLPADMQPAWLGYSVGRWEAGTLVVDTAGFNDKAPLDAIRHPRSELTHLTERFRRLDFGHMEVQVKIDDPQNYSTPFTINFNLRLLPDTDVLEKVCAENEKDLRHLGLQ